MTVKVNGSIMEITEDGNYRGGDVPPRPAPSSECPRAEETSN